MKKRTLNCCIALVFLCSFVLMISSCAKKQVQSTDTTPGAAIEGRALTEEEIAARKAREAEGIVARARTEAERQEMLARMRAKEGIGTEIQEFQEERIYFDFDKSDLKSEAREVLRRKADWLRKNPEFKITITGHCDERGTREYNMALGQRRADAAFKYLNSLGVSADRIVTVSKGKEEPLDPRSTPEAWAKNRRAEFKVSM
ncbi:MAG: peptidoglycan-associated lipoprotein Pal [Desulfatiglandaceae bacterium]